MEHLKKLFNLLNLKSSYEKQSYPKTVILEVTNLCNLKCKMCHFWGDGVIRRRNLGYMEENIWKKAIDELSQWSTNITLALHGAGEPLMHRDFLKILKYATSKENLFVGFLSNGSLWTKELANDILSCNIGWLCFSVDGAEPEKFKKYRNTDLKKIESIIEYIASIKKKYKPLLSLNMVALQDLNQNLFIDRWINIVDEIKISVYRPIGHRDFLKVKIDRLPCYMLNEMLVITWDGKAVLCCEDIWAENILGHFPEQSLYNIWNSLEFNKIRKLHEKGKYDKIPICKNCDSWSNILIETEKTENLIISKCPAQTCYLRSKNLSQK